MDEVIVPTLVPPPLSPFSSFSSETPSLRKSLSRKSSLQKILSVSKCNELLGESVESSTTARSEAPEESSAEAPKTEPLGIGRNSSILTLGRTFSKEGSMDVDDYCAVRTDNISDNAEGKPQIVEHIEQKSLPVTAGDGEPAALQNEEHSVCSEGFHNDEAELTPESSVTNGADVSDDNTPAEVLREETEDEQRMDTNVLEEPTEDLNKSVVETESTNNAVILPASSTAGESTTPDAAPITSPFPNSGPPPIEILFSFDTTGSMSYYLDEVKNEINNIIHRLFMDIPNLKIGVIAHGDYCDASVYYLTQNMDLTSDVDALCAMVKNVEGTGGGDFEECYELIMRMARQVKWTPGSQRALVMIGDACPHTTDDLTAMGKEPIDWKVEAAALRYEMGVNVYGVQCQDHAEAGTFWQDLASVTRGEHLKLDKFATIIDIMLAICYRECGPNHLQAYELEVRAREGRMLATELDQAFQVLRGGPPKNSSETHTAAGPSVSHPSPKATDRLAPKKTKLIASAKTKPNKVMVKKTEPKGKKEGTNSKQKNIKPTSPKTAKKETHKRIASRKPKQKIRRLFREQVTEAHFLLNQLKWTPWIKVIAQHDHEAPSIWQKRHRGVGFTCCKNLGILNNFMYKHAMYELAVQLQPRGKQIVVYNIATKGTSEPDQHWSRLVFKATVNKYIDNVLRQCPEASISIRRALLPRQRKLYGQRIGTAETCRSFVNKNYDYAWKGQKPTRTLVKKGVTLVTRDPDC